MESVKTEQKTINVGYLEDGDVTPQVQKYLDAGWRIAGISTSSQWTGPTRLVVLLERDRPS